jgi:hypothetical protein
MRQDMLGLYLYPDQKERSGAVAIGFVQQRLAVHAAEQPTRKPTQGSTAASQTVSANDIINITNELYKKKRPQRQLRPLDFIPR